MTEQNNNFTFWDTTEKNTPHNPAVPLDYWFQHSHEGFLLFVVFYTQKCRWSQCFGCSLHLSGSESHIDSQLIMQQVDHVFESILDSEQKLKLKKIIVSNNGSVLDEATFPKQALLYFISKMKYHCPNVSLLTLETRAEYAQVSEFESIERALKAGEQTIALELAVGVEVFNNKIRNRIYKKGLSNKTFEHFAAKVARFDYQLKTYFMLKPIPDMSDEEAVADIVNAVVYLDSISERYNLKINLHLNMTYVSTGTELMEAFENNQYSLASLSLVPKAILAAENTRLTVYVGLYDEGLAIKGGHFEKVGNLQLIKMLQQFNQTQDYGLLKKGLEKHEREPQWLLN
ncbi:MAG: hypothetical protein DRR19_23080 [Candidatus Parabeggiatoa sp. nov. 1]|nr:MAG: hypothetical protein DRR19_23080 [Gammaproteobacteria bacterium]